VAAEPAVEANTGFVLAHHSRRDAQHDQTSQRATALPTKYPPTESSTEDAI
jgi:hypothetical protein